MKNFFKYLYNYFKRKYEFGYYFELDTVLIDKKYEEQEALRVDIINYIRTDLVKHKKDIQYVDLWPDTKEYITGCFVTSEKLVKEPHLIPLAYEVFAYRKLKKLENFSYEVETKIFKKKAKEIQVLKFKVEC